MKRRVVSRKKIVNSEKVVYVATSPLYVTEVDEYGEIIDAYPGEYMNEDVERNLAEVVKYSMSQLGPEGLAPYFNEDFTSTDAVEKIIVTVEDGKAKTYITCNRELTSSELKELEEYLIGQFSDGWGEGFEQHAITESETQIETEYEDEETGEVYTEYEYIPVYTYVHFWNDRDFYLDITRE